MNEGTKYGKSHSDSDYQDRSKPLGRRRTRGLHENIDLIGMEGLNTITRIPISLSRYENGTEKYGKRRSSPHDELVESVIH